MISYENYEYHNFPEKVFFFLTANDELKAVFAEAKEGNIRVIKVDIQDGEK